MVGRDGVAGLSGSPPALDHRRCRGQQRLSATVVESGVAGFGERPGPADLGLPFPAGHEQVEQDGAPHVLLHHEELAWQAASLASRHRQLDRRHDNEGGLRIQAELDTDLYRTGIRISDEQLAEVQLQRATFHGEWNYTIAPQN